MTQGPALSFVLLERAEYPQPAACMRAASELGLTLTEPAERSDEGPMVYAIEGGGQLAIMLIDMPIAEATSMPSGLASPDADELARVQAHLIVTAMGLPDDPKTQDSQMARLTAAVVQSSPAVAAMMYPHPGVCYHRAGFFVDVVRAAEGELPMLVCVAITAAPEPGERMSFLTHGLARYGREEFYVTASQRGKGALDFVLGLAEWMLADPDKQLPSGDTVGRSEHEKVVIQRVPSPLSNGTEVIRLDLDV